MNIFQSSEKIYIPPFSSIRLVVCRHHFQLVPVPGIRTWYGYGKVKACKATVDPDNPDSEPIWSDLGPNADIWVIMQCFEFEDGHKESGDINFLRPECSEDVVRKRMEELEKNSNVSREELLQLTQCFEAKAEDYDYIDDVCPNYQSEPNPNATDDYDVYHARLKVMSELQPKTVELIKIANLTQDPEKRRWIEGQAVQSFFAELAHYFTEDEVLAWQRSNPVGTGWMCEFGEVMREPRRRLDLINHELALNWMRQKYSEMTANQLAISVFNRVWKWLAPDFSLTAAFIKKRRERLGLTTKRPPGPRPQSDQ